MHSPSEATEALVELAQVAFPDTTGPGAVIALGGVTDTVRSQVYTFTADSRFSGAVLITATDRADNAATVAFTVTRDALPPQVQVTQAP